MAGAKAGTLTYDTKLDGKGFSEGLGKLGKVSGTIFKGIATAVGTATTAVAGLVGASVKAYAEFQQLEGGVEALFGKASDGYERVINTSKTAYKELQMSQNQYLNAFNNTYSIMKNGIGKNADAIEYTNRMISLSTDLYNTYGGTVETYSSAINWALKGTYSYIDNLNLGIKGTKEGFIEAANESGVLGRNIKDTSELTNDEIVKVIEYYAQSAGALGRSAEEARKTISGSFNMMKASWEDLIKGMSDKDADMSGLINNFVESVEIVGENLLPVIEQALNGVATLIDKLFPKIAEKIPEIITNILPKLIDSGIKIVQSLLTGIQQNLPSIIQGALQIIQTLAMGILQMLPQIIQIGIQIIIELARGLAQMLPILIPVMVDAVITIVETLLDNIDMLVDAAIQLILALADGLIEALPRLIEKAPEIIEKLVNAIIRNFPKIVEAGGQLIGKLVVGIIGSIIKLREVAPKIIKTLNDGIKNGFKAMVEAGNNLIKGLWEGILSKTDWLLDKIKSFAHSITDGIKKFFGIQSPSKVMRDQVGQWLPKGIAVGIDANTDSALKSIDRMNNEIMSKMNKAVSVETGKINAKGSVSSNIVNSYNFNMDIDGSVEIDGQRAGRILTPFVSKTLKAGGLA